MARNHFHANEYKCTLSVYCRNYQDYLLDNLELIIRLLTQHLYIQYAFHQLLMYIVLYFLEIASISANDQRKARIVSSENGLWDSKHRNQCVSIISPMSIHILLMVCVCYFFMGVWCWCVFYFCHSDTIEILYGTLINHYDNWKLCSRYWMIRKAQMRKI